MVEFKIRAIDQDIVKIYYYAIVQKRAEDIIDKVLEGSRGIRETKRHHYEFIMTVARAKSCLWHIFILDTDLVVAGAEVKFGEDFGTLDSVEDLINMGERISIFDH